MPEPDVKSANIHLELDREIDLKDLEAALNQAGIQVRVSRTMTAIHDGYSLTDLMTAGIWDHETGYRDCNGKCAQHMSWDSLTPDQQHSFMSRYTQFLENCRVEELQPVTLLASDEDFEDIRLTRH